MKNFNKMWKIIFDNSKSKRSIQELEFENISLEEYIILDVRSRREFKEYHLKGAINIPLPDIKKNIETYIFSKNKKIIVYCQSGIRSKKAVMMMEKLGYTHVYNLKGGLENI